MDYFPPLNGNLADPNRPHINANLGTGVNGSMPDALGYHAMMMSLLAVIDGSGIARDAGVFTVLRDAIEARIAAGAVDMSDVAFTNLAQLFAKAQGSVIFPLVEATPVVIDLDESNVFELNMTASRTFGQCLNVERGRPFLVLIKQPVGGGCGLGFNTSYWDFPNGEVPENTTTGSAIDMLIGVGGEGGRVSAFLQPNFL
jgi:hypothetical protein